MQFQNLQVQWEQIPKASTVDLKPVEKTYLKVLYISWSIMYAIILSGLVALYFLVEDADEDIIAAIVLAAFVISVVATFIIGAGSFKRKGYAVREKDILFRTGWIIQKLHIVPFNRVQHCVVQSGPIGRKFGLASLSIYTAASNITDISIRGLKTEDAETLKAYILEQIQPLT
jgi:uncharacterized protein